MIVGMWMAHNVATVQPEASITDAAALMAEKRIRRLPVVARKEEAERLVGIVTASDIYRAFPPDLNPFSPAALDALPSRVTVEAVMNMSPLTTEPEAPIEEVARVMRTHKIGALPVVREATLVGLITESDIFRAFVSLFDLPQGGARVTFDLSKGEDLFGLLAGIAKQHGVRVLALNLSEIDGRRWAWCASRAMRSRHSWTPSGNRSTPCIMCCA